MVTPHDINEMLKEIWPDTPVLCEEVEATQALAVWPVSKAELRPGGTISGPTIFGCADSAFWFLINGVLGHIDPTAVTQELSIRFLRPARGPRLYGRAKLERRGRTSVVATVYVWVDDESKPCAIAQGTYQLRS
ncbi:MAG: PaaI family thioesterase [Myxococcota bacterium]|nr:PaaI family thioesterase [Myxococcota bacterium]